jgi:hypothetical protein
MPNETNQTTIQAALPEPRPASRSPASVWRHLPAIAKCIVIVPLTMALLGAEIELRLSPQLDVLLTAAGAWAMWAWFNGRRPPSD